MNQTREIDDAAGRAAVARLGSVLGIWLIPTTRPTCRAA
jgi:hypothetical protein